MDNKQWFKYKGQGLKARISLLISTETTPFTGFNCWGFVDIPIINHRWKPLQWYRPCNIFRSVVSFGQSAITTEKNSVRFSCFLVLDAPLPKWKVCGKLAANLPQTCSTLFSAPEKLRNSVQKCAASGTLLAHNKLCATESKVVRQNWNCVREVCHNIFLVYTSFYCVPEVRQRIFFVFLFCQGIKSVRQSVPE